MFKKKKKTYNGQLGENSEYLNMEYTLDNITISMLDNFAKYLRCCYELNMPPKIPVEILTFKDGIRRWNLWEMLRS